MLNKHCVSEKMTSPIAQGLGGSHGLLKGVTLSCLYEDNISSFYSNFGCLFSTLNYLCEKLCVQVYL